MKGAFAAAIILSVTPLFGSPAVAQEGRADAATQAPSLAEFSEAENNFAAGLMLATGDGVPKDDALAAEFFRSAAEAGHARAQYILGVMYKGGEGVPENDAEAVKWYRLAAEQGDAVEQFNLGVMYAKGEGAPGDYVQSYIWLNLAAAQGDEKAADNKDILRKQMTPAQVAEAQRLSAEWKPVNER